MDSHKNTKESKIKNKERSSGWLEQDIEKILKHQFHGDSLIQRITNDTSVKYYHFDYQATKINLDGAGNDELLLYFFPIDNHGKYAYVYALKSDSGKIDLIDDYLYFEHDQKPGQFNVYPEHDIFIYRCPIFGTCDDGYRWNSVKLVDDKLKNVAQLFGEHEGSTCGEFKEEDDSQKDFEFYSTVSGKYEILNKDTIVNTCKVSHWKIDQYMDTWTEKIITDREVKLYFVFNAQTKSFDCYNQAKQKMHPAEYQGYCFEIVDWILKGEI